MGNIMRIETISQLHEMTGYEKLKHPLITLIETAKNMLLGTREPVNRIASSLGFEYPQHFSKLFKKKPGYLWRSIEIKKGKQK